MIDQIVQGIFLGGYYALVACGLSFMYGVMRIINLAHGSLVVLSAFLVWYITEHLGISPFIALLIVIPIMAAAGWILQRTVLDRSLRSGPLTPLLSTFGLAIVIDNLLFQRFGADSRSLGPNIGTLSYNGWTLPGGVTVSELGLLTLGTAIVLIVGLQLFLKYAPLGRAIRATSEDRDTAELMGIDSRSVYAAAAAIALATVAIAGMFLGMRTTFAPYAGATQLIFAFESVVIGGTGSLWGTLVGAIALGVAQNLGALVNPQGFFIAGHLLFFCVLAVRFFAAGSFSAGWLKVLRRQSA
ncbi:MAG TPA: branched-chain amino acid ABC transporter permease [Candidatus Baltobacteraceae bacterium]|nr:branched-chain amino acid ABC transporter permease [Candidatus Baltobacteraceae bacterium]